jgi:hypothetical protein
MEPCVGQRALDEEELRAWLQKMSDAQVLEFGRAAASLCKPLQNSTRPIREVFILQLRESRAASR